MNRKGIDERNLIKARITNCQMEHGIITRRLMTTEGVMQHDAAVSRMDVVSAIPPERVSKTRGAFPCS